MGQREIAVAAHSGSVAMSLTYTGRPRYAAVPHEPASGPISDPSIASRYGCGRCGAAPCVSRFPSALSSSTDVSIWLSDIPSTTSKC